jgi:predicted RNase H-like nuclease (RuvC/YqgF family)
MNLETKKKILELKRVETARMELELKIEERLEEIERLRAAIEIQKQTEEKLKKELS